MVDGEKEISLSKLLSAIQETKEDLTKHSQKNSIKENCLLSTPSEQVKEMTKMTLKTHRTGLKN